VNLRCLAVAWSLAWTLLSSPARADCPLDDDCLSKALSHCEVWELETQDALVRDAISPASMCMASLTYTGRVYTATPKRATACDALRAAQISLVKAAAVLAQNAGSNAQETRDRAAQSARTFINPQAGVHLGEASTELKKCVRQLNEAIQELAGVSDEVEQEIPARPYCALEARTFLRTVRKPVGETTAPEGLPAGMVEMGYLDRAEEARDVCVKGLHEVTVVHGLPPTPADNPTGLASAELFGQRILGNEEAVPLPSGLAPLPLPNLNPQRGISPVGFQVGPRSGTGGGPN